MPLSQVTDLRKPIELIVMEPTKAPLAVLTTDDLRKLLHTVREGGSPGYAARELLRNKAVELAALLRLRQQMEDRHD